MTLILQLRSFLLIVSLATAGPLGPVKLLSERYPNRLITSSYGIVTADDLAYEEQEDGTPADPYDPAKSSNQRYWQCLSLGNVELQFHYWKGEDGMGSADPLCDMEIHLYSPTGLQIYHDRRGHPAEFCDDFKRHWNRLTKGENVACLEGHGSWILSNDEGGKYRSWAWNALKTRRGCYGECEVLGCAQGKCPK